MEEITLTIPKKQDYSFLKGWSEAKKTLKKWECMKIKEEILQALQISEWSWYNRLYGNSPLTVYEAVAVATIFHGYGIKHVFGRNNN